MADEFYPILNEQHKEAQVDIREDLTVLVDGDKMARVFNNIMKNAVAYSYEGSTITIEAGRRRRWQRARALYQSGRSYPCG